MSAPAMRLSVSALSLSGFVRPRTNAAPGRPPELRWIDIDCLYVDRDYQREILRAGRDNILKIAGAFNWAFFAPVVVAPLEGSDDFFVIIDGQHRCMAAKLMQHTQVPCSIITADRAQQARAFAAINGNVTAISSLSRFKALLASGDANALRTDRVAAEAGVKILRVNASSKAMKAHETTALNAIDKSIAAYGERVVKKSLEGILASAKGRPHYLQHPIICSVTRVLAGDAGWLASPYLMEAFEAIDLRAALVEARSEHAASPGRNIADFIDAPLIVHLGEFLEERAESQSRGG
jgi:hypothetical protein